VLWQLEELFLCHTNRFEIKNSLQKPFIFNFFSLSMVQIDWQYYKLCLAVIEYIDLAGCGPGGKSQLHYKVDGARGLFADIGFTIFGSLVFEVTNPFHGSHIKFQCLNTRRNKLSNRIRLPN
jgi:hypothetical protein